MVREEVRFCSIGRKKRTLNDLEGGKGAECAGAGAKEELPLCKTWALAFSKGLDPPDISNAQRAMSSFLL